MKYGETTIYLSDLVPFLQEAFIRLDHIFLKNLLIDASKSGRPHRNREFAEQIGYTFNNKAKCSTGLERVLRINRSTKISKLERILSLSKYDWEDVEENIIYLKAGSRYGETKLSFPISVSKKLGSIVGHILGDGSIDRTHQQIFFSNSNKELLYEFQKNMGEIFSIKPRIWFQESGNFCQKTKWLGRVTDLKKVPEGNSVGLFYPTICARVLYAIFGKFACGKNKCLTKGLFAQSYEFKVGLLRAIFDDEGRVDYSSHMIRLYQDDKKLLEGVQLLLRQVGITPNKLKFYLKRERERHYFSITGFSNHYIFYKTIGFTSSKKMRDLKRMIDRINHNGTFRLRCNETKENIKSILKGRKLSASKIRKELAVLFPLIKWNPNTVRKHLRNLEKDQIVSRDTTARTHLWFSLK